jgi:hypothetical protein
VTNLIKGKLDQLKQGSKSNKKIELVHGIIWIPVTLLWVGGWVGGRGANLEFSFALCNKKTLEQFLLFSQVCAVMAFLIILILSDRMKLNAKLIK